MTENRYSGIPTIRRELRAYGLGEPDFTDSRGSFSVCFHKAVQDDVSADFAESADEGSLLRFCRTPKSRKEICEYLGLSSTTYAIKTYVQPLIDKGVMKMTLPDKPQSMKQRYYAID